MEPQQPIWILLYSKWIVNIFVWRRRNRRTDQVYPWLIHSFACMFKIQFSRSSSFTVKDFKFFSVKWKPVTYPCLEKSHCVAWEFNINKSWATVKNPNVSDISFRLQILKTFRVSFKIPSTDFVRNPVLSCLTVAPLDWRGHLSSYFVAYKYIYTHV